MKLEAEKERNKRKERSWYCVRMPLDVTTLCLGVRPCILQFSHTSLVYIYLTVCVSACSTAQTDRRNGPQESNQNLLSTNDDNHNKGFIWWTYLFRLQTTRTYSHSWTSTRAKCRLPRSFTQSYTPSRSGYKSETSTWKKEDLILCNQAHAVVIVLKDN